MPTTRKSDIVDEITRNERKRIKSLHDKLTTERDPLIMAQLRSIVDMYYDETATVRIWELEQRVRELTDELAHYRGEQDPD